MDLTDARFIPIADLTLTECDYESSAPRLSMRGVLEQAHQIVHMFESITGEKARGRIARYSVIMEGFLSKFGYTRVSQVPVAELARFHRCAAEVRQLRTILVSLGDNPDFREKLTIITKGTDTPADDRNRGPRNLAFELYVAARFTLAGFSVTAAEPDLIVNDREFRFGVAVKRLGSESKLVTRLREGIRQIRNSGLPGIVAIDISTGFRKDEAPAVVSRQDATNDPSTRYVDQIHRVIIEAVTTIDLTGVLGFLLCLQTPVFLNSGPTAFNISFMTKWLQSHVLPPALDERAGKIGHQLATSYNNDL